MALSTSLISPHLSSCCLAFSDLKFKLLEENFLAGIGLQFADPRTGSCTGGLDCRTAAPTAGETVQIFIDQPSVVDGVGRDCNRVDRTRIFSV